MWLGVAGHVTGGGGRAGGGVERGHSKDLNRNRVCRDEWGRSWEGSVTRHAVSLIPTAPMSMC